MYRKLKDYDLIQSEIQILRHAKHEIMKTFSGEYVPEVVELGFLTETPPHGGSVQQRSSRPVSLMSEEEEWRTQCTARLTRVVSP